MRHACNKTALSEKVLKTNNNTTRLGMDKKSKSSAKHTNHPHWTAPQQHALTFYRIEPAVLLPLATAFIDTTQHKSPTFLLCFMHPRHTHTRYNIAVVFVRFVSFFCKDRPRSVSPSPLAKPVGRKQPFQRTFTLAHEERATRAVFLCSRSFDSERVRVLLTPHWNGA